ncbi:zinc-binding dehydrogenase [Herbiconiux ginsengi]|nr:nuclear transport factor 2 family protein [Herbiconiux ginsengi]
MNAVSQETLGSPDVLKLVHLPVPSPRAGEILVAVNAAGVNPTDWSNRARVLTIDRLPLVLGWDVSGIVEAVGVGVTIFKPGDEVFGMLPYPEGVGSHAEFVTAPARVFSTKPAYIDHVQAAALPLASLTAYQALVETAGVRSGQRVLIHAAAGGVGHLAIQIAKSRGAYVIGTARANKHDFVRSMGADEVIDYEAVDLTTLPADIDIVLDSVSFDQAGRARSLSVLRRGGTLISILPVPLADGEAETFVELGVRFESLLVQADGAGMNAIADLVENGQLRAHIEATFPLAQAAQAHALGETGRTSGKIVLTVREARKAYEAADVLRAVFEPGGDLTKVDALIRPDYIQHNPLAPDGPEAMKAFGAAWKAQFPEADYVNIHALTDADIVLLHSHGITVPGTSGLAVFDIFRFQDGKIAEHWDILQEVPDTVADNAFTTLSNPGSTLPTQRWFTPHNREVVRNYVKEVLGERNLDSLPSYVGPDYFEHGLHVPRGGGDLRADLAAYFEANPQLTITPKRFIAEGDFVAVHSHYQTSPDDLGSSVIDLFRVRDLKIVEHWSAAQDVPAQAANNNTMF